MNNKNNLAKLTFTIIISGFAFFIFNRAMDLYLSLDGDPVKKLLDTLNNLAYEVSKNPFKLGLDRNSLIIGATGQGKGR